MTQDEDLDEIGNALLRLTDIESEDAFLALSRIRSTIESANDHFNEAVRERDAEIERLTRRVEWYERQALNEKEPA